MMSVLIRVRPFLEEELAGNNKKSRTQCVQFYSVRPDHLTHE